MPPSAQVSSPFNNIQIMGHVPSACQCPHRVWSPAEVPRIFPQSWLPVLWGGLVSVPHPTIPPASWLLPVCLALPCLPLEAVVWNGPLGRFGVVEEVTAQERGRGTRGAVSVAPFKFAGCSHPRVSLPAPSLCGAVGCPVPVSVSSLQSLGPCSPPRLPISCHCFGS